MSPAPSIRETGLLTRTLAFWRQLLGRRTGPEAAIPGQPPVEERRVWVRYPSAAQTTYEPIAATEEAGRPARVLNISRGGINLLLEQGLPTGSLLCVDLPGSGTRASSTVLAYVVRAAVQPGGAWAVACTFARELSATDLEPFGAQRVRSPTADQRYWKRFACSTRAVYHRVTTGEARKWPAQVLDISGNGIGLAVAQPVDAGALLSVELEGASPETARVFLACVVRVNLMPDGQRVLGCNFIRELTDRELQALR